MIKRACRRAFIDFEEIFVCLFVCLFWGGGRGEIPCDLIIDQLLEVHLYSCYT